MTAATWVLKEWAIAVNALLAGDLILLVRKGGIREAQPYFEVPSDRPLLFPTYEHQQPAAMRPPYSEHLKAQSVPQIGDEVPLAGRAEITHQLPLRGDDVVTALHPFHIWTDEWLAERLAWKPDRPAYALLLRAYRFNEPWPLVYQKQYAGCRSWLALGDVEGLPESAPVLSAAAYEQRVAAIQAAIAAVTASVDPG